MLNDTSNKNSRLPEPETVSPAAAKNAKTIETDAVKYDKNMQLAASGEEDLIWYSPDEDPFYIAGLAWYKEEKIYRRLPLNPDWPLREAVDNLANCTAGGQIRFRTDSRRLSIRVQLDGPAGMNHMPATGQCGFDCYIGPVGEQKFLSVTKYDHFQDHYDCQMMEMDSTELRHITLNFPLYKGVKEVSVGLDSEAKILPPAAYLDRRKIIIYGTSITQGGCAARPGMCYTNILSRYLNYEFINLGFSGNGKGDPELAWIISQISDPGCIVLDYEANCPSPEAMAETLPEFIRILRITHKEVPILVVSRIPHSKDIFVEKQRQSRLANKKIQKSNVEQCKAAGDENIYFQDGHELFDELAHECTVDGGHPTDMGFMQMASSLKPLLKDIMAK